MITCPNCGATARNGAKFCTTCGTRLTGITPAGQTPPAPATAATTSTSSTDTNKTSIWSWPATTEPPAAEAGPIPAPEPASAASADEWDWPAPFSVGTAATMGEPTIETDSTDEATEDPALDDDLSSPTAPETEADALSSWAAQWDAGPTDAATAVTSSTDADFVSGDASNDQDQQHEGISAAERVDPTPDAAPMEPLDEAAEPVADVVSPADDREEASESAVSGDLMQENAGEQGIPVVSENTAHDESAVQTIPDPARVPANDHATSRIAGGTAPRAIALLDELRELLSSSNDIDAEDSALPTAVAASLREALEAGGAFDALHTVATHAKENPRDLYAMMDLGRHTSDILALIAERDRLRAAIASALATTPSPEH